MALIILRTLLACLASLLGVLVLLPLLLIASTLLLISGLTRLLFRLSTPPLTSFDQLVEYDPTFGWKPRANLKTYHLCVDPFKISTDGDGWRGRTRLEESEVVVFGDSFAAGYGVDDEHFFANLFDRPRIKPVGIGGYSLVQELLWMHRLAPALEDKLVVWFIYFGNDIHDNLSPDLFGYRRPFLRAVKATNDWQIVDSHVRPERWTMDVRHRLGGVEGAYDHIQLAALSSDSFLARRSYSACEYLIRRGKQVCEQTGASLLVLTIPDPVQLTPEGKARMRQLSRQQEAYNPDYPDQQIEAICEKLEVGYVAGKCFLDATCYKPNDCHWNQKGHRKVAEALADLHRVFRAPGNSRSGVADLVSRWKNALLMFFLKTEFWEGGQWVAFA